MGIIGTLLVTSTIAGVVGTGLGGLIGAMFRKESNRTVSLLLSFAAGVMTSVVCFELVLQAIETKTHIFIITGTICGGVAIVYLFNLLIDKKVNREVPHIDEDHPQTADDLDELIHSNYLAQQNKSKDNKLSLFIAGLLMASAIALHNIPEGMTIGASYASNNGIMDNSALLLAILIGLHHIPEGMAVSVPLINGGMKRFKAIGITALSGAPTILGALLGYWIGDIGSIGLAISLCFASGAMLYVVFGEILPEAILMYRSKAPAFFTIIGMMVGLLIIYL